MRQFLRAGVVGVAVMMSGLAGVASAQTGSQSVAEPRSVTVTPFLSGTFGTSNGLDSSLGIGAAIGYDLTRNLGFEAEFGRVFDVAGDNANLDWSLTNISANVLYHFDVPRATPYAVFGIGWERSSPDLDNPDPAALIPASSTEVAWNVGAGVKVPINERFLARADIRRFQANDLAPDSWRLYGGLTFWIVRP